MKTPIKVTRTIVPRHFVDVKTLEGLQEISDILQKPLCVIETAVRTHYGIKIDEDRKGNFYFVIDGNVMYCVKKPQGGKEK